MPIYKTQSSKEKAIARQKRWRDNNPDTKKALDRRYRLNHPVRRLLARARERAKAKMLPFDIVEQDIIIPDVCPILNIPLKHCEGKTSSGSISLDRLVPEKGYVKGNIRIISYRANTIKNNGTAEEHRLIAEWMERELGSRTDPSSDLATQDELGHK